MMTKFSFLQKILSPAVSAGKITDFIVKYDGEFIVSKSKYKYDIRLSL